ncbi:cytochrome P450 [Lentinula raphanica]|nr:cytochrome P450 [Lentinula raphanica]
MFGVLLPQSNMLSLSIHEGASSIQNFTIAAGIVLLIIGIFRVSFRGQPLPLPPGPKGYPIIKNAFDVPSKHAWLKYHEWSKHLGDVLHLSPVGQSIIVLNSARAISELLEGRSAIYFDRPWTAMTYEVGYQDSPVLTPSGPRHRTFRRLSSEVLGPRQVQEWRPLQEQKVQILVRGLLESPQSFWAHIRRYTASLLLELSHGQVIQGDDDPFLKVAQEISNDFSELAVPGRYLVDIFPGLRFLPSWVGLASKKRAISARKIVKQGLRWTYRQVENQVANGTARPSFAASLIERNTNPSQEEIYIHQWVSLVTYTAGGDTSLSALTSFFLAMALNPDKQRKAQAEIDRVVGFGNRPTFGHRSNLQYVESLIKEVYRLNPAFPMALPHALNSKTDDEYRGWRIPKGSTVIANTWAVLHDANLYPSPFEFLPERYLEVQSSHEHSLKEPAAHIEATEMNPDPRKFAFGYGRGSCPGQYLIDDTIFIAVATVLALFDIGPLTSGSVPGYTPYVISQPEAFACTIAPRTKAD